MPIKKVIVILLIFNFFGCKKPKKGDYIFSIDVMNTNIFIPSGSTLVPTPSISYFKESKILKMQNITKYGFNLDNDKWIKQKDSVFFTDPTNVTHSPGSSTFSNNNYRGKIKSNKLIEGNLYVKGIEYQFNASIHFTVQGVFKLEKKY